MLKCIQISVMNEKYKTKSSRILRYIRFCAGPVLIGLIFAFVWIIFPREWLGIEMEDAGNLNNEFNFIGISHAIFAAGILTYVWHRNGRLKYSIKHSKREVFNEYVDDNIPDAMHFLLFIFSACLVAISLLIPEDTLFVGAQNSFFTAFIVTVWWEVAHELDDWRDGFWVLTPPEKWVQEEDALPEPEVIFDKAQ